MTFATIDALRESLASPTPKVRTPEYIAKMLHPIPQTSVVDRVAFILSLVQGKRVLEFGASGPLHEKVRAVASIYAGVDREANRERGVIAFDLDDVTADLPSQGVYRPEVILCGEVLEHLGNPQHFLLRLKAQYPGVPVILSVPNAFTTIGQSHLKKGVENVNGDHVNWYSYTTLRTLLSRAGYTIRHFHWYNGEPLTAEGLIVVCE